MRLLDSEILLNPIDSALKPSFLSQVLFSVERITDFDGSLSLIGSVFNVFTSNKLSTKGLEQHLLQGVSLYGEEEMIRNVTRFIAHVISFYQRTQKQQEFVKICGNLGLIDIDILGIPKEK